MLIESLFGESYSRSRTGVFGGLNVSRSIIIKTNGFLFDSKRPRSQVREWVTCHNGRHIQSQVIPLSLY